MVRLNGKEVKLAGKTPREILDEHDLKPGQVAVFVNGELAKEEALDRPLEDGDEVEIVAMVQGGEAASDALVIAGKTFQSRLMVGTGKFKDLEVMKEALLASGAEIVTVAIRRVELGAPGHRGLLEALDTSRYWLLPNTAGAKTAEEAVRIAEMARAVTGQNWIKPEVIPDPTFLLPDPVETLKAAEVLLDRDFVVLPYIGPDPVLASRLARLGTATVMPLAAPIGSGWGVKVRSLLEIIVRDRPAPVVIDAGLGLPSHAAEVMEFGADAILVNTAIAEAKDPVGMARAFRLAVEAGRSAHLAGPMPRRATASPSSPREGIPLAP